MLMDVVFVICVDLCEQKNAFAVSFLKCSFLGSHFGHAGEDSTEYHLRKTNLRHHPKHFIRHTCNRYLATYWHTIPTNPKPRHQEENSCIKTKQQVPMTNPPYWQ